MLARHKDDISLIDFFKIIKHWSRLISQPFTEIKRFVIPLVICLFAPCSQQNTVQRNKITYKGGAMINGLYIVASCTNANVVTASDKIVLKYKRNLVWIYALLL